MSDELNAQPYCEDEYERIKRSSVLWDDDNAATPLCKRLIATADAWKAEADAERALRRQWEDFSAKLKAAIDAIREPKCDGCGDMNGGPCACAWAKWNKALAEAAR